MKLSSRYTLNKRHLLFFGGAALLTAACSRNGLDNRAFAQNAISDDTDIDWLSLTEDEWKARLTPEAFRVLRKEGTERAFTSPLNNEKREGVFHCAGCDLPLFESAKKYDSGTGWPSFWDYIPGSLETKPDNSFFMRRTEYHCSRCLGHQGHVFDDGPRPTRLRYCNNGVALTFRPA